MQVFEHYQQLERYIGWTGDDARRMRLLRPLLSPYFHALVDDFYAEINRHHQTARVITGGAEQIARLKRTLHRWLDELFSGRYDESYVAQRWDVGKRHVAIGLDQLYTNASMSRLRRGLLQALEEAWRGEASKLRDCRDSLNALLDLNLAIIEHAYHTEYERRQATAERLSTVGKIAGSIVEELRGPIAAAKSSIESLRAAPESSPEAQRVHLGCLDRQVNLAEAVISALNDFVRLPVESFQPVEIIECLKQALSADALLEATAVRWDLPVERLKVLGAPAQLRTVLSSLIRNVHRAMPPGDVLRLGAMPDGDAVYVTIGHSGECACSRACPCSGTSSEPGHSFEIHSLPSDIHSLHDDVSPHKSFQRDYSIHSPALAERKSSGLGLGLSILHDIVLRHRGALTITTDESVGTLATLQLPTHH